MNTADPVQNITVKLGAGESAIFSDDTYDYRYYRVLVSGNTGGTATEAIINGVQTTLGGIVTAPDSVILDIAVWQCEVLSGHLVLFGVKSVKTIFGN